MTIVHCKCALSPLEVWKCNFPQQNGLKQSAKGTLLFCVVYSRRFCSFGEFTCADFSSASMLVTHPFLNALSCSRAFHLVSTSLVWCVNLHVHVYMHCDHYNCTEQITEMKHMYLYIFAIMLSEQHQRRMDTAHNNHMTSPH